MSDPVEIVQILFHLTNSAGEVREPRSNVARKPWPGCDRLLDLRRATTNRRIKSNLIRLLVGFRGEGSGRDPIPEVKPGLDRSRSRPEAAVGAEGGHVRRLVEEPDPLPFVACLAEILGVDEQLLNPPGLIRRVVRQGVSGAHPSLKARIAPRSNRTANGFRIWAPPAFDTANRSDRAVLRAGPIRGALGERRKSLAQAIRPGWAAQRLSSAMPGTSCAGTSSGPRRPFAGINLVPTVPQ